MLSFAVIMFSFSSFSFSKVAGLVLSLALSAAAAPIIYDGRAPMNLTEADLDSSTGPYLTCVCAS